MEARTDFELCDLARGAADNPDSGLGGGRAVLVIVLSKALRDERQKREDGGEKVNHVELSSVSPVARLAKRKKKVSTYAIKSCRVS